MDTKPLIVACEPKAYFAFRGYTFTFLDGTTDQQWAAFAFVREELGEKFNVRQVDSADAWKPMLAHPFGLWITSRKLRKE